MSAPKRIQHAPATLFVPVGGVAGRGPVGSARTTSGGWLRGFGSSSRGKGFGQQLPQHVGSGAFFLFGEDVDLRERFRAEPDRDLLARVSVRHVHERIPVHGANGNNGIHWDVLNHARGDGK